jgi:hypothetical protein
MPAGLLIVLGSALAVAYWFLRTKNPFLSPDADTEAILTPETIGSVPVGWKGDPVERPRVHEPIFENSTNGRQEFVRYLRGALMNIGLTHGQALLFIAHKARESGWGKSIWNYNFGNIKTGSKILGPYFWLTDRLGFRDKYRAYDTPEDGIFDNLNLVRKLSRYQKSWALLMAEDPSWYGQLGLDGYYEGPPDPARPGQHTNHTPETIIPVQAEYNSILSSVKRFDTETG